MPPIIRHAVPDDHLDLVEQFQALNVYEDAITHDRVTVRAGAEESLAAANEWVAKSNGAALVAEVAGRVVGHLFLTFEHAPPFVREDLRSYAHVTELFVRPEARRAGIARALLQEAERIARERGASRIMLGVLVGNHLAEAAYSRAGFVPYATEMIKEFR